MLKKIYYSSDLRNRINNNKKIISALVKNHLVPQLRYEELSKSLGVYPDRRGTGGAFEVLLFDGPLICEGKNGYLFKGRRLIRGADDGLGRLRSISPTLFFREQSHVEFALSLHTPFPQNYYHFIAQTLPKLIYAERALRDIRFPLIVSEEMAQTNFFKGTVELGFFSDHPIIVQRRDKNIRLDSVAIVKASPTPYTHLGETLERLGCTSEPSGNKKVYIHRSAASPNSRLIRNIEEVSKILLKHEFELVDPMSFTLAGQIDLFRNTSEVISPHGAGLTNIIYRNRRPLRVLEIFNHNLTADCYQKICEEFDYDYHSMFSENVVGKTTNGSSEINIEKLSKFLESGCT
ncbi:glycosyltransferase family 61 protein [Pseudovibrio exalbescens]|uniref:glycosyltransferase family 61 protein n=1 Tax=Pseudovibrio exalbescens TaxID=197461 RepID=UPI000C9CCF4F|nr:glycosyltransferase family 61 protein [Pseudovibrio exalbescens]